MTTMKLSLGPLQYFWPRERTLAWFAAYLGNGPAR